MARDKKKISKFDRAALGIAEGIANIPLEGKKRAMKLLEELENKPDESEKTKKFSAKIRTEVKKKTSRSTSEARKRK